MHRRAGKSILCAGLLVEAATSGGPGSKFHYIAPTYRMVKAIIFPALQQMCAAVGGVKVNVAELTFTFANGATIELLSTDNIDALRGRYSNGCIVDEAQMMPVSHWTFVIRPLLADRKGWAVVTGTPAGRHNLLAEAFHGKQWDSYLFPVSETDALDEGEIADLRLGSTDQAWAQEFECDFDAAIDGAFYAPQVKRLWERGGVTKVQMDKRFPVLAAIDLGHHDLQPVLFAQEIAGEIRVFHVETYRFTSLPDVLTHVQKELKIDVDRWILPHDAQVRDLTSGLTRKEVFERAGYDAVIAPNVSLYEGIEQTRQSIDHLWIDEDSSVLYEALAAYRSDKNEETGVTKIAPLHDWSSHYADAYRYLVLGDRMVYTSWGKQDVSGLVL